MRGFPVCRFFIKNGGYIMGFKFTDRICNIEINEKIYPVVFQKPLIDRLEKAKGLFAGLKDTLKGTKDIDVVCNAIDKGIDILLGDGSAAAIFADRFPNAVERYAVLQYVYDEIIAFTKKIAEEKNVQSEAENTAH
jgi:hypothetical protein